MRAILSALQRAPSNSRRLFSSAGASTSAAVSLTKKTTGIVGLDVVPDAKAVLVRLYEKTLNDIRIIPSGVPYRVDVEAFTKYRLDVVRKHEDVLAIEKEIGCGQVEELIEDAKGELILIPQYASWKAWEKPRASPQDDEYAEFFEDLAAADPEAAASAGVPELSKRAQTERVAEARRQEQITAAAAAAKVAAPAPPPAAGAGAPPANPAAAAPPKPATPAATKLA